MDVPTWVTGAAFLAGFMTIFALNLLITDLFLQEKKSRRKRLEAEQNSRLRQKAREYTSSSDLSKLAKEAAELDDEKKTYTEQLKELITQAGLEVTPGRLMATSMMLSVGVCCLLGVLTRNVALSALASMVLFWVPIIWVKFKRTQRQNKLQEQLPDALELMGRILRAGQTMPQAMLAVSSEFQAPIATEFGFCHEQQNLGLSAEVSLRDLSRRTGLLEIKIFVLALLVHRRSGGNLAELLQKLSGTIRERYKIRGKIKALTSEGRLQAIILLAMPPVLFGVLLVVNNEYAVKLFDHQSLIAATIISMALGAVWIRKIVNFDF
jgi:tight adherence protein B